MDENYQNENNQDEINQEIERQNKRNKASYTLWILAGAYLLYMVYKIVRGFLRGEDDARPWMLVVCAVFAVAAIGMIVMGFRGMKSLSGEDAAQEPEEPDEPAPEPARRLSISEKAHLADNLQVPEGVVNEIGEETEEE